MGSTRFCSSRVSWPRGARLVDDTHAAFAELRVDAIAIQRAANHLAAMGLPLS
jgi:hypothetical protein